ncbi:hypothetical protein GH714_013850 [Hevea brasiliensis]|uniref:Uncharacterized protein n=1 Tax=Hevea brasiliensis TaxID=3981 RepID=A0A6A6LNV1_HEVBR|nr:hypothetical protein GH714_013850 [Hevea brasiliensis]
MSNFNRSIFRVFGFLLLLPALVIGDCTCENEAEDRNKSEALKYKAIGIAAILVAGAIGFGVGYCGPFCDNRNIFRQNSREELLPLWHFSSLTTPVGIAIGIGISNVYKENSPTALIVEGIFNSASAGILIYMALVDLLAADFMNPKVQGNGKLQLGVNLFLLLGAGLMSLLAKWA